MTDVLPATMRLAHAAEPGGPEVLHIVEGPVPRPREGEVLIRVAAAGLNGPDLAQRAGRYAPPPGASPVIGLEVAGTIVARGAGVDAFTPGAEVTALVNGGGYAEYCVAPSGQCLPFPAGFDAIRAAALPENVFTVWANLFGDRATGGAGLAPGETLLVHGGSSSIGLTAIQLGRSVGAEVIATAGSEAKCAACLAHGAAHAIDYRATDFAAELQRLTGGRGVDVILDVVGAAYLERNLASLAPGGRLVLLAVLGGAVAAQIPLWPIISRRLHVTGSLLRPRSAGEKAAIAAAVRAHVWPLLDSGAMKPVIERVFPLDSVAEAHALMEAGTHIGKVMLAMA